MKTKDSFICKQNWKIYKLATQKNVISVKENYMFTRYNQFKIVRLLFSTFLQQTHFDKIKNIQSLNFT